MCWDSTDSSLFINFDPGRGSTLYHRKPLLQLFGPFGNSAGPFNRQLLSWWTCLLTGVLNYYQKHVFPSVVPNVFPQGVISPFPSAFHLHSLSMLTGVVFSHPTIFLNLSISPFSRVHALFLCIAVHFSQSSSPKITPCLSLSPLPPAHSAVDPETLPTTSENYTCIHMTLDRT